MKDRPELIKILLDRKLARLGDAYLNFAFSLALSKAKGTPEGVKVSDRILAAASREAGLRKMLPKRTSTKDAANAFESLMVEGYLSGVVGLEETVDMIADDVERPATALANVASIVVQRLRNASRE